MAEAKTPDRVDRTSLGATTLLIATFETNDIDDGDTWVSGLLREPVIGWWSQRLEDAAVGKEGMAIAYVPATGVFTFYPAEDDSTFKVFVILGSG